MLVLITIGISSTTAILGTDLYFQDYNATSGTKPTPIKELATVEAICLGIFNVEYLVQLICYWAVRTEILDRNALLKFTTDYEAIHLKVPFMRTVEFLFAPSDLVDVAAMLPGIIGMIPSITLDDGPIGGTCGQMSVSTCARNLAPIPRFARDG